MKKGLLPYGLLVLGVAVIIALALQLWGDSSNPSGYVLRAKPDLVALPKYSENYKPVQGEVEPKLNSSVGTTQPPTRLPDFRAIRNYRAAVQKALAQPNPLSVRTALEIFRQCDLAKMAQATLSEASASSLEVPSAWRTALMLRLEQCGASGGLDFQMRRALLVQQKRLADDEWLGALPGPSTAGFSPAKLKVLASHEDVTALMDSFGEVMSVEGIAYMHQEPALRELTPGQIAMVWQLTVAGDFAYDDEIMKVTLCLRQQACAGSSYADALFARMAVEQPETDWMAVRAAMRRRFELLVRN